MLLTLPLLDAESEEPTMAGAVVAVAVEEEDVCLAVVVVEGRRFRLTMLVRPGTTGQGARGWCGWRAAGGGSAELAGTGVDDALLGERRVGAKLHNPDKLQWLLAAKQTGSRGDGLSRMARLQL